MDFLGDFGEIESREQWFSTSDASDEPWETSSDWIAAYEWGGSDGGETSDAHEWGGSDGGETSESPVSDGSSDAAWDIGSQEGGRGLTARRHLLVPVQVLRRGMRVRRQLKHAPDAGVDTRLTWGPPEWSGFNWRVERRLWEEWYFGLASVYVGTVASRAATAARLARAAAAQAAVAAGVHADDAVALGRRRKEMEQRVSLRLHRAEGGGRQ